MRRHIPAISEAESVVMQSLWRSSPSSAEDVFARVAKHRDWQKATVKTLLSRLLKKGAVQVVKDGRRYLYSARFTRDQWLDVESKGFLDRLFGGRVAPLVAHFSERRKLTDADLAELKRLLKKLEDDR